VLVGAGAAKKPIAFFLLCDLVNAQAPVQEQTKAMEAAAHKMANAGPCDFRFVPDINARAGAKRKLPAGAAAAGDATSMFEVELALGSSRCSLLLAALFCSLLSFARCSLLLALFSLFCSLFCHSLYRAAAPSVRPHR
jgi:hypothetical protein